MLYFEMPDELNFMFIKILPRLDVAYNCLYNCMYKIHVRERERENMSKVKYTDAPLEIERAMDSATPIDDDFLPSPEYFAEKLSKERISLYVDTKAIIRFKAYASRHGIKYQSLMNQVLSNYAEKRLD